MEVRKITQLKNTIWKYFKEHGRQFPWRNTKNPYKIWVSEVMLQQTQTTRVIEKYKEFLKKFPTVQKLAEGTPHEVLSLWSGLGYNRRALFLLEGAKQVITNHKGKIPRGLTSLLSIKGIGRSTASAIRNFAWQLPTAFIETNIRDVYIHFFFTSKKEVSDKDIFPLVEKTLPTENPKEWFYALMDYGVFLKSQGLKHNLKNSNYQKQTRFKGSVREARGEILRLVLQKPRTKKHLLQTLRHPKGVRALKSLITEGLLIQKSSLISIA